MWRVGWRDDAWNKLDQQWDILVIGGGITGAGIAREAARRGWRALLVEQRDFAWGTSSRSSKLVHGGLRYLAAGEIGLTRDSVREREQLLAALPGLVTPLPFIIPAYAGKRLKRRVYQIGLTVYDALAGQWRNHSLDAAAVRMLAPHLRDEELEGGLQFADAQTDDARLVLRVLGEAVAAGATALNYVAAAGLVREDGRVAGALLRDAETGAEREVRARVVINATGAWVDGLREQVGAEARMRPLRGSHLVFAAWRFPLAQAVSIAHPADGRPVFALPWEGATIVGTTDIDHDKPLDAEPAITGDEAAYLLAAVAATFPALQLAADDIVSTWSGVRPVVNTGRAPSEESRDHVLWNEQGLLTVTGGKLTTFRLIARDALEACAADLPPAAARREQPQPEPALPGDLPPGRRRRLLGRYGERAAALTDAAAPGELAPIAGLPALWAELRWAARAEGVVHLDDLLLRRLRIGLLLPRGAAELLPEIRRICQPELGWSDARWAEEERRYLDLIAAAYGVPASIPAPAAAEEAPVEPEPGAAARKAGMAIAAGLALGLGVWLRARSNER